MLTPKLKEERGRVILTVLGRLRAEVSPSQADAELRTVVARTATAMHESDGTTAFAMTIGAYETRDVRAILLALLGAVVCVLLVACANVANLLLVRGTQRQREIAVRVALGATRGRIVRQLLIENLVLALAGGAAGVLVAIAGLHAVRTLAPPSLATLHTVHVHAPILAAALVLSIATGMVCGVVPAWMSSQLDVNHGLKQSAATVSASRTRTRFRSILVAFEIAAALVLLTGAGLLTRSFNALSQLGTGLDVTKVSYALLTLPPRSYGDAARRTAFARTVLNGVRALPNVASVAAANTIPLRGGPVAAFLPDGMHVAGPTDMPVAWMFTVSPDYFSVIRLPLLRGRTFAEDDDANASRVLMINRTLARQYFPNEDPVGRYISVAGMKCEVIGVVADVAQVGLQQLSSPQLYGAFAQWPMFTSSFNLMIRAHGAAAVTRESVRSIVAAADPALSVGALVPLQESLDTLLARQRFAMTLLNVFGIIGAVIAAAGVYSVMAYATSQRSTEIGIRMAFGASTRDIFTLVMRQGAAVTGLGALAGIAAALAFARLVGSMLYEVRPHDPITLTLATFALIGVVLMASIIPALRAIRLNPIQVLRAE